MERLLYGDECLRKVAEHSKIIVEELNKIGLCKSRIADMMVNAGSFFVGVVDAIGTTYEESKSEGPMILWMNMLNMAVLLSANLGVMNLLPLPALDGGRLVFLVIEAIRRKPINRQVEGSIHFAGLMLLMALMVFVMYNDIVKLI